MLFAFVATGMPAVGLVACGAVETIAGLLISREEETALGIELAQDIEQELVIHPDPFVHEYLTGMGLELLALIPDVPPEYQFRFQVVKDDDVINAFAAPGGQIYFYTGLMLQADTRAEVMGVMGHEIAHVMRRHGAQQLVTNLGLATVLDLALGQTSSSAVGLAGELAATGALLKYGRDHELESDEYGMNLLLQAGYDPEPYIGFFSKLDAMSGSVRIPEFLSTHPNPNNRVSALRAQVNAYPGEIPSYRGDDAEWRAFQARLRGNAGPGDSDMPTTP